jgi:glycosyl transferase family 87
MNLQDFERSPWSRFLAAVSAALILFVLGAFYVSIGRAPTSDFMTFRAAGAALLRGGDIYAVIPPQDAPNLNPPFAALLFVPLAAVSISAALAIWASCIVACLAGAAAVISRTLRQPFTVVASVAAVLHPTLVAVAIGQMGIPLLLILTVAWAAHRRQVARLTGLAIGLAVALKIFVAVLLVSLCIRREWRALAWAVVAAGVAVAVGAMVVGLDAYRGWFLALGAPHDIAFPLNGSLLGLIHRSVADPGFANVIWLGAAMALGVVVVALLWRVRDDPDRSWGIALAAALLLSPLGWIYYFPILIPPLLALSTRGSRPAFVALMLLVPPVVVFPGLAGEWLTGTLIVSIAVCATGPLIRPTATTVGEAIDQREEAL